MNSLSATKFKAPRPPSPTALHCHARKGYLLPSPCLQEKINHKNRLRTKNIDKLTKKNARETIHPSRTRSYFTRKFSEEPPPTSIPLLFFFSIFCQKNFPRVAACSFPVLFLKEKKNRERLCADFMLREGRKNLLIPPSP